MLAEITQNITPAFNSLCTNKIRSAVAIVAIVIGSAAAILLVAVVDAVRQPVALSGNAPVALANVDPGYPSQTSYTSNQFYSRYQSLNAVHDLTMVATNALAFVVGASILVAIVGLVVLALPKLLAHLPSLQVPVQSLMESAMLVFAGGAVGTAVAFVFATYMDAIIEQMHIEVNVLNTSFGIALTLLAVVGLRALARSGRLFDTTA